MSYRYLLSISPFSCKTTDAHSKQFDFHLILQITNVKMSEK